LKRVEKFQDELVTQSADQSLDEPEWIAAYVQRCVDDVPFYRRRTPSRASLTNIPTCSRADLASKTWDFVPDSEPLDELVVFSSSGTTGHPTRTPHHPFSAACGVPLIEYALRELHGIKIPRGAGNVAITNIVAYPEAFTTAITVSYLQEAGCVRVNLDSSAWRIPSDREQYINQWKGPIWLGDPVAFEAMEQLSLDFRPHAIVSSIMHLTDGHAARLHKRYGCPVVDLYAMTEAGIIATRVHEGYRILPHDLFVEILDEKGARCPPGVRGEITLTQSIPTAPSLPDRGLRSAASYRWQANSRRFSRTGTGGISIEPRAGGS
jgi:phenylacetate-CoA ligase